MKKIDKNIILIVFISIILLSPLLSGKYLKGHDTFYHYSNIKMISETIDISKGKIIPDKVVPIISNNMGWGNGIFYPSFPQYVSVYIYKFLTIFGVSILTTMNLVHFCVLIFSGIFMYLFVKKLSKNDLCSLISAIMYITFPYFFMDIGIRDAYSETFLFMCLPLVFLGIEYLFEYNYKKFYIFFILGYFVSINSHLVMSIYLTFFVMVYLGLNIKKLLNKKVIARFIVSAIIILGLSSPFLIPLIEHTILGNYAVYSKNMMWNMSTILRTRVGIYDYFLEPTKIGYISLKISYVSLITFILILFNKNKFKENCAVFKYAFLAILVFVIMLPIIPWNLFPKFLLNIQLVWRNQLFLVFFMSVVSGFSVILFRKNNQKNYTIIVILLAIINFFSFYKITYLNYIDPSEINVSETGSASYQYLPKKSYNKLNKIKKHKNKFNIIDGEAKISKVKTSKRTVNLSFNVITDRRVTIEIPRFYYLGYDIKLNGENLKYKESDNGLIKIKIPTSGRVVVDYSGTIGYQMSKVLFLVSLFCFIFITLLKDRVKLYD